MPGYELIDESEFKEIAEVFKKSKILCRMGFDKFRKEVYKVKTFENLFAKFVHSKYALGVTSGTAALRVALSTMDLKPGDEIITQSFTFVATVEAIIEARAVPVLTEIDDTLNLDPNDLLKKITKRTKAVIVVHMLGVPARLDKIKSICDKKDITLIEDTAWGCGGKFKNKYLGTWGRIGTFSFDHAKSITTGEGGMIIFKNKNDFKKASAWHDHGHENNPQLPRWKDTRKNSGFNFRMNEMQGAVGIAQLRKLKFIIKKQKENHDIIWNAIKTISGISRRYYPTGSSISADALVIFVENKKKSLACRKELLRSKISTKILPEAYTWHFAPTWKHIKELKKKYPDLKNSFYKSKQIIDKAVSIPIFVNMNKKIPKKIRNAIKKAIQ
jgi:8-amino-3,8-dideoxy-alpha-D-manno-octulosonate transaminase